MNITAQGTFVIGPYNSEFIKFAILPKKIPIGDANATRPDIQKHHHHFFLQK